MVLQMTKVMSLSSNVKPPDQPKWTLNTLVLQWQYVCKNLCLLVNSCLSHITNHMTWSYRDTINNGSNAICAKANEYEYEHWLSNYDVHITVLHYITNCVSQHYANGTQLWDATFTNVTNVFYIHVNVHRNKFLCNKTN